MTGISRELQDRINIIRNRGNWRVWVRYDGDGSFFPMHSWSRKGLYRWLNAMESIDPKFEWVWAEPYGKTGDE